MKITKRQLQRIIKESGEFIGRRHGYTRDLSDAIRVLFLNLIDAGVDPDRAVQMVLADVEDMLELQRSRI